MARNSPAHRRSVPWKAVVFGLLVVAWFVLMWLSIFWMERATAASLGQSNIDIQFSQEYLQLAGMGGWGCLVAGLLSIMFSKRDRSLRWSGVFAWWPSLAVGSLLILIFFASLAHSLSTKNAGEMGQALLQAGAGTLFVSIGVAIFAGIPAVLCGAGVTSLLEWLHSKPAEPIFEVDE